MTNANDGTNDEAKDKPVPFEAYHRRLMEFWKSPDAKERYAEMAAKWRPLFDAAHPDAVFWTSKPIATNPNWYLKNPGPSQEPKL